MFFYRRVAKGTPLKRAFTAKARALMSVIKQIEGLFFTIIDGLWALRDGRVVEEGRGG